MAPPDDSHDRNPLLEVGPRLVGATAGTRPTPAYKNRFKAKKLTSFVAADGGGGGDGGTAQVAPSEAATDALDTNPLLNLGANRPDAKVGGGSYKNRFKAKGLTSFAPASGSGSGSLGGIQGSEAPLLSPTVGGSRGQAGQPMQFRDESDVVSQSGALQVRCWMLF